MHAATRRLGLTWMALLALAGLTFALSLLPLGALAAPVALTVATAKAALVVLFFMELSRSRTAPRVALLLALLLLVILLALAAADALTRIAPALPPR